MLLRRDSFAAGSLRLILAGCLYGVTIDTAIAAGPPIPFDQYTVNSGDINAACPTSPFGGTITCKNGVVDDGMLQREITISGVGPGINGTYIQFIVTDPGVTGDPLADPFSAARDSLNFTNEDFVKMNNRQGGITSKQTIIDSSFSTPTLEDRFVNSFQYNFGWAGSNANPWVDISQDIGQVDYSADPSNPIETLASTTRIVSNGAPGFNNELLVSIDQRVDLSESQGGNGAQGFRYVHANGSYNPTASPGPFCYDYGPPVGFVCTTTPDPLLPGGTNGGSVTWNQFDDLKALWIGQILDNGSVDGSSRFGVTQYSAPDPTYGVLTTAKLTSFSDTTAVNWEYLTAALGTVPTLSSVPVVVAATYSSPGPDTIAPSAPPGSAPSGATISIALPVDAYNDWTVADGVFSVGCTGGGVVCGPAVVNEGGVFQRMVWRYGVEYIQTINTDVNATGDPNAADFTANYLAFRTESFVRGSGVAGTGGIAAMQHIAEQDLAYVDQFPVGALPSTAGQFAYTVALKTGDFNGGPLDPRAVIDQRLLVPDYNHLQASSMDTVFHLEQGATPSDKLTYQTSTVGTLNASGGFANPVMFATAMIGGVFQDTSHSLADPDLLPSVNGDIAWAQYDAIQATWVGGEYIATDPFAPSIVATTSYANLSTGDRIESTSVSRSPPNPETWTSPFLAYLDPTWSSTYVPLAF